MHRRRALHLVRAGTGHEGFERCMDHHGRAILIRVARQTLGTESHESVGAPRVRVPRVLLARHDRDARRDSLEGPGHHRALRCRQLGLEPEPSSVVEVPPRQRPAALDVEHLVDGGANGEVALASDRAARHAASPAEQVRLGLGGREPGQLDELVDPQVAGAKGGGDSRQVPKGVRCGDPTPRLPVGDAIAHSQPVRHVARAHFAPRLTGVDLSDQGEKVALGMGDTLMQRVDPGDHLLDVHSRRRSGGRTAELRTRSLPNVCSVVKPMLGDSDHLRSSRVVIPPGGSPHACEQNEQDGQSERDEKRRPEPCWGNVMRVADEGLRSWRARSVNGSSQIEDDRQREEGDGGGPPEPANHRPIICPGPADTMGA
jgi:hypothetical protein